MKTQFSLKDTTLWLIIAAYVGFIYGSVPIVSSVRKYLVEQFGPKIFDYAYGFVGVLLVGLFIYCFRKFKTKELVIKLLFTMVFSAYSVYYLSGFNYAVEKLHFVEYGILGILIYGALYRHVKHWTVIIITGAIVYWIGIGDEIIKYFIPNRVSEIRNALIDTWSGLITSTLLWVITKPSAKQVSLTVPVKKILLLFCAFSTIGTSLFIGAVHRFGYLIETGDPGRIYSSFNAGRLLNINIGKDPLSQKELLIYENEALRHLFQREFYFTNDFKASNGSFYRDYWRCFHENSVLEYFYPQFMNKHARDSCGKLIISIDKKVAQKVAHNPVQWTDTIRAFVKMAMGDNNGLFSSRVKEIIITSFSPLDLLVYSGILLCLFGYWWGLLNRQNRKQT